MAVPNGGRLAPLGRWGSWSTALELRGRGFERRRRSGPDSREGAMAVSNGGRLAPSGRWGSWSMALELRGRGFERRRRDGPDPGERARVVPNGGWCSGYGVAASSIGDAAPDGGRHTLARGGYGGEGGDGYGGEGSDGMREEKHRGQNVRLRKWDGARARLDL